MEDHPVVPADEVGDFLARHRPPTYRSVALRVPAHAELGPTRHEAVLNVALVEVMNMWPKGTVLIADYSRDRYAQALAYPPALLTEIGRLSRNELQRTVDLGWIDPVGVPHGHPDFESQPVWIDNPVREWTYPVDTLPEIASFLARSVREILACDPAAGYTVHVFNNGSDDDGHGIGALERAYGPGVDELALPEMHRRAVLTRQ